MKQIILLSIITISFNLYSQSDDEFLNQKFRIDDSDILMELQNRGLISETEKGRLGLYLVMMLNQGVELMGKMLNLWQ